MKAHELLKSPDDLKRARRRRTRWGFGVLLLFLAVQWYYTPIIVQPSDSMKRGIYLRSFGAIDPGSAVLLPKPASITPLLEAHGKRATGYLLKPVIAVGPAELNTLGDRSQVNGIAGGMMEQVSSIGIPYPEYRSDKPLQQDEVWVESHASSSVDSRVFGPVSVRRLRGPYWLILEW